ncbi:MAG: DUF4097 family beta strand repeat protein [Gammaproteobacteria bacterium]|nr:DUF4097 family beta strand repeat protein [Gammaproteobacteria bacterium]
MRNFNSITITIFVSFLACLMATSALARNPVEQTLTASADGKVKIKVIDGDVVVKTWNKAEVSVFGELDKDANQFIFESRGDEILIEVKGDHDWRKHSWESNSVDLIITVPSASSVEATSSSAEFVIEGVQGDVHAHSASGDITLVDVSGAISLQSMSGDLRVMKSSGKLNLSSVSGDIDVEGNAQHLDVTTVSGDVDAKLARVELMDFTSVSGDLEVQFELADKGRIDANTVSGDMRFDFANKKINARFDIETGPGGDIENQLSDARAESSFIGAEKLKFELGSGRATIELRTMSGTIDLRN